LNRLCFAILDRMLQSALAGNADILVDCGLNHLDDAERLTAALSQRGAEVASILFKLADEKLWEERCGGRRDHARPNQRLTDPASLRQHDAAMRMGVLAGELVLDAALPPDALAAAAAAFIAGGSGAEPPA
jgi:hypothetical protein